MGLFGVVERKGFATSVASGIFTLKTPCMDLFEQLKTKLEAYDPNIWEGERLVARNEFLAVPNTIDTNIYYIEEGSLRVCLVSEEDDITIRFGYPGNFFGTLDAFLSGLPTKFGIKAIKRSRVKVLGKERFMLFLREDAEHLQLWQNMLMGIILDQGERELDLLTSTPHERYQRVLQRSPQLFQLVPGRYIASYLRMTPETFTRIKKS